jgi:hypothetical protein
MATKKVKPSKSSKSDNKSNKSNNKSNIVSDDLDLTITEPTMSGIIYPCKDDILYTKIMLLPQQMNNELYLNLKKNLIEKVESKCSKDGYIVRVYKILDYKNGIIEAENFTGSATYSIKYLAKICIVIREMTIVAKVVSYVPETNFIVTEFGPIIKIISSKNYRDINQSNLTILGNRTIIHNHSDEAIKNDIYVKIQIKSVKFNQNDKNIKCMGYIYDIATSNEIAKYSYREDSGQVQKGVQQFSNVYFNDEEEIEDKNIETSLETKSNYIEI